MSKRLSKYIHLIFTSETKFIVGLVDAINDSSNGLLPNEHTFITPFESVYSVIGHYDNVLLDTKPGNLYIRYSRKCKWLISHARPSLKQLAFTPRWIRKKILYRYWGNSKTTCIIPDFKNPYKYVIDSLKIIAFRVLFDSFACIGVANSVDILDISRVLKNGRYYIMPYIKARNEQLVMEALEHAKNERHEDTRILLGHRGTKENNHIKILQSLVANYSNDNIHVYIPLSYGDNQYISHLKDYISGIDSITITIIDKLMDYKEYVKFLAGMDVCIFDGKASYALDNIGILLSLHKILFINSEGIIRVAFDKESIPYKKVEDIDQMDFHEFVEPMDYSICSENSLQLHNLEYQINAWKEIQSKFN